MEILKINKSALKIVRGNITEAPVEAIVNAANRHLAGGGGVDGAIHRAAGPSVMEETRIRYPHGCNVGEAVVSAGGNLSARYIIHTVGPIWKGGSRNEAQLLRNAWSNSLDAALELGVKSIAFPSISTGAYYFPIREASHIAVEICIQKLQHLPESQVLNVFIHTILERDFKAYCGALRKVAEQEELVKSV